LAEIQAIYDGRGPVGEEEREHLSAIIKVLNERFGLQLTIADQLLFDQFEEGWVGDSDLAAQAQANTLDNFRLVFADAS
jgi:type I restriction enzyme R subunit